MKTSCPLWIGLLLLGMLSASAAAEDPEATKPDTDAPTYRLQYKFQPGETVRWEVTHQARIRSTVSGTTEVTEMVTKSVKAWRVTELKPDGTATFEHLVESVDMRQKFSGRQEVRYNSLTDEAPPPGFESLAASIGVPISVVTINAQGQTLHRQQKPVQAAAQNSEGVMTIPLPDEAVPVGHRWSFPFEIELPLENGTVKKIKTLQTFQLEGVKTDVATIQVATKILTPLHDATLEAKLIQREQHGTVRFDLAAGRILGQQMDLDRRVVGFTPNNPASSLHYLMRFTETLLADKAKTASRPQSAEPAKQ